MNYLWDRQFQLFRRDVVEEFAYSDGVEFESRLLDVVTSAKDRSTFSRELAESISDWPSEYHFSRSRHCLVRPLGIGAGHRVLELGCGCGAITRFLGETGADVVAVEGSLSRARIAAERCRDLENVRVVVDNLASFIADERFDFVLFIGVLEYAAVFSDHDNPFVHHLRSASQFLAAGGRVVVAIENELGLKYFNGCGEDHVGIPFFGIQELYGPHTVRTFGRRQMLALLSAAGLPYVRFYYPFPDYKLPSVILSEEAFTDVDFDPVDMLARCHSRDYIGSPLRSFDEALVFSAAHKNGLLAEVSNSFLVVAMAEPPPEEPKPDLATAYSANRAGQFATQTRVRRRGSRIEVLKGPLSFAPEPRSLQAAGMTFTLCFSDSAYVQGRQLLWKLLKARVSSAELEPTVESLRPWILYLLDRSSVVAGAEPSLLASYVLPGCMLDCTPFNLLESNDGLVSIDTEWQSEGSIPVGWVVTRGLLYSLGAGLVLVRNAHSILELVAALCGGSGLVVSVADVLGWLKQEREFQVSVTGRSRVDLDEHLASGIRSFASEIAGLNRRIQAHDLEIGSLREALAARDHEILERDQEIQRKDELLCTREEVLRIASDCLDRGDQQTAELNRTVADLSTVRAKLKQELDETRAQCAGLQAQLDRILHSRSWRYTSIFRRLTRRIAALVIAADQNSRQLRRDREIVAHSGFFDSTWYLAHNPDVRKSATDPITHYLQYGGAELRDPGPNFSSGWYLDQNPDVRSAGVNPLVHYARFGILEGRKPRPDPAQIDNRKDTLPQEQSSPPTSIQLAQQEWDRSGRDRLGTILAHEKRINIPAVSEPVLSIIMVLHNQAHLSLLSIESVIANADVPFELILVNNASRDETARLLERISGTTILCNSTNVGFGPACTQAAARANGKYLCFINNDVLLQPNSLGIALDNFSSASRVGAVGGKMLLADGSLQEAGSIIWSDGTALGYGRGDDPERSEYCFRRPVDYCSGAFLFTPTELFRSLGGFSAEFAPAYYEDTDYCMTLWQSGLRVVYEPQAVILHYESGSSGGNEAARFQMAEHQKKFAAKWRGVLPQHRQPRPENVASARIAVHSKSLRIVYVDDRVPRKRLGSGYCRANYIVNQLASMGHCVTCVSFDTPMSPNGYCDVRRDIELFDGFSDRRRLLAEYVLCSDVVWVSRPHNMRAFLTSAGQMTADRKFRLVYDAEAIFAEREQLKAKIACETPEPVGDVDLGLEMELAKAADAVVVVSQKDRTTMLAQGIDDVYVIGHQISPTPTPATFDQRRTILFVGAMHGSDNPNADSMRYFCRSIWPQVRNATSATLVIVGYGTDAAVGDLSTESIRVLGARDDLIPFYDDAKVFIVPTRYAAGIPYKAHEAAAQGVPMVVSELIARQLGWRDEEDFLVAGDDPAFAANCCRLFRDPELWQKLRSNALVRVEQELSEPQSRETLEALIGKLINPRTGPARLTSRGTELPATGDRGCR